MRGVLKTVCLFLTLCFYNYLYDETIEVSVSSKVFRLLLQIGRFPFFLQTNIKCIFCSSVSVIL